MESIRKQLKGSSDKGFTLIELLVVVLILGILSVIAVIAVNNARTTAIQKACIASATAYVNAFDQYAAQNTVSADPGNGSIGTLGDTLVTGGYLKAKSASTDYTLGYAYVATPAPHITVSSNVSGCSAQ